MHSKVLAINDCRDRHRIKEFHEDVVSLNVITTNNLFSEGKVFSHVTTFMIASKDDNVLLIVKL